MYTEFAPQPGDIVPQPGYQIDFLTCEADIAIGGGAAGAGKTIGLLLDAVRDTDVPGYGAIIFRQSFPQIMMQGGLWDSASEIYPYIGGAPRQSNKEWIFEAAPRKLTKVAFSYLSHENDLPQYQGAQIPFIGFDELTHFSFKMFLYMLTRNRSTCGIKPRIRATCNPDPDSWLADFISWWIDQETGFPIPERAGVIRYMTLKAGNVIWGNTKQEVLNIVPDLLDDPLLKGVAPEDLIKSVTFLPGTIQDNQELLKKDPAYLGGLLAQDEATQMRLLRGNWRIRADKLSLFDYTRLKDMFTAEIQEERTDLYYITCDHARFGRDLCVIGTWKGWKLIRIDILLKSDTNDIMRVIKMLRLMYRNIPSSQIIIDQDGIGVKDIIDCRTFHGGSPAIKLTKKIEADYKNLRTQCYYYLAEEIVNKAAISIDLNNCFVHYGPKPSDIHQSNVIKLQGRERTVRELIRDDLRVLRREEPDAERKKQMTTKEEQKAAIGNRSPDFGDMMALRAFMDFVKQPRYLT